MTLVVPWLIYPLVAALLALGLGLLLETVIRRDLPGALVLPAGFAVEVVVSSLTTASIRTARLTTPLLVVLAVVGLLAALRRGGAAGRLRTVDRWTVGAAVGAFAVYAAPIVLSGSATFSGYVTLDDTATWLALADNAMTHGRSIAGIPPSTYEAVLHDDNPAYPIGSFVPLGVAHELTGQDPAWLFQPQIAFLATMLALAIRSAVAGLLSRPAAAITAFLAAQSALLYGYGLWSGIKELTTAALVALLAALAADLVGRPAVRAALVPLAVVTAAILDVLSVIGIVWLVGIAIAALPAFRQGLRGRVAMLVTGLGAAAVLSLPALIAARTFVHSALTSAVTSSGSAGLGNLIHPLSLLQLLGVWPVGDFRQRPDQMAVTGVLLVLVVAACAACLAVSFRRRVGGAAIYLVTGAAGALAVVALGATGHGSPWLDGKALAVGSPALVAGALAGAFALVRVPRFGPVAVGGAVLIAGGVAWSNALAYGNAWLAPRAQLAELQWIGERFAGEGPALMTEYQPYGVRHFLRRLDGEGASERRARPVFLRTGAMLDKGQFADIDSFELASVLVYRTLVLRGSPFASRPPSVYRLAWSGRYYEVWQRPVKAAAILEHLPLGVGQQPSWVPACTEVHRLATLARRAGGHLVASVRAPASIVGFSGASVPDRWQLLSDGTVIPHGNGSLSVDIAVPRAGTYQLWLGGSFRATVSLAVDGRVDGTLSDQLSQNAQAVPFSPLRLTAGRHTVVVTYHRSRLDPGTGSYQFAFGPLDIGRPATTARLLTVRPAAAASLCGRSLDWLEAVGG